MKFGFDDCDEGNMDGDEGCTKFNVLSKYKFRGKKTIAYINTLYIATINHHHISTSQKINEVKITINFLSILAKKCVSTSTIPKFKVPKLKGSWTPMKLF